MVWFFLNAKTPRQNEVWQYPKLAVDAYTLSFDATEFIGLCQQRNVKYVFLYEYNADSYFNTTITQKDISAWLDATHRFTVAETFGTEPHRIFVLSFG
jgi:hypothetical protein